MSSKTAAVSLPKSKSPTRVRASAYSVSGDHLEGALASLLVIGPPHESDHHAAANRNRLQCVGGAAVPPHDRPSCGLAERGAKHHVAEEVPVVNEPRYGHVARA